MKASPTKSICFFNSNRAWGGGEKWHYSMAKELIRHGYKTTLVTNLQSQLRTKAVEDGLNVYSFSISNLSFLNPVKIITLYLFFKVKKFDTVIVNLPADLKVAGISARLAGVKNIIYRRGMPHALRNTWLNRFLFEKVLTKIIVNSNEIGRSLSEGNESWFPKDKLALLYNGISLTTPHDKSKKLYEKKGQEFIIGNAGRLTPQKGQKYLIEMAEILHSKQIDFKVLIAGEGELRSSLSDMVKLKGLQNRVILLGHVTDMAGFMNSLDVFVFPSLFEGSANTLIETLFYEKPIVAFDVSSNPEIIENGVNGFLTKSENSQDLAERVIELINSVELREKFVTAGQRILREKFNNQEIIEKLKRII